VEVILDRIYRIVQNSSKTERPEDGTADFTDFRTENSIH
jgi:hypothetical protein